MDGIIAGDMGIEAAIGAVHGRVSATAAALLNMHDNLMDATDVVYEHTRQRFEDWGDGEWPELAEATVTRKAAQGYPEPDRPLFASGDLFESATSPFGPYSYRIVTDSVAVVGVDWSVDGRQIPPILSAGNELEGGFIPARPIWPHDDAMVEAIKAALRGGGPGF